MPADRRPARPVRTRTMAASARGEVEAAAQQRLNRAPAWLAAVAIAAAPITSGGFSTPPAGSITAPSDLISWLGVTGLAIPVVLLSAAALLALYRQWRCNAPGRAAPALALSVALLVAWAALSLVRDRALYLGLNGLMLLIAAAAAGGLFAEASKPASGLQLLTLAPVAGATAEAILGIQEYLLAWNPAGRAHDPTHRVFGTFINPDFLAGYLILVLPLSLACFAASRERNSRLLLGFGIVLQSGCLLLTGSRAGLAALLAGLAAWLALCIWSGVWRCCRRRIAVAVGLLLLGAIAASAPTRSRLANEPLSADVGAAKAATGVSGKQAAAETATSHSLLFREYTWQGTVRMILANPLLGAGLGGFAISYPRYGVTAYTAHAHNSLLQWTSETGVPGALFLLLVLAAVAAFAVHALREHRQRHAAESEPAEPACKTLFDRWDLIACGVLAGGAASTLKTFVDSDWYVGATCLTFGAFLGLLISQSRLLAPEAGAPARPARVWMLVGAAAALLFALCRGIQTFAAQSYESAGASALAAQRPEPAVEAFSSAAAWMPYDPQPRLELGAIYGAEQDYAGEERQLRAALSDADIAQCWYRMGEYYEQQGRVEDAVNAFQRARALEPTNVQNLRHLGDALARAGKPDEAAASYRQITTLERGPYGTVRAVGNEVVETEFAWAHAGLANLAAARGDWAEAARQDSLAGAVLNDYWMRRNDSAYAGLAPARRSALAALYDSVLKQRLDALRKAGAPADQIQQVDARRKQLETDIQADQAARAGASAG